MGYRLVALVLVVVTAAAGCGDGTGDDLVEAAYPGATPCAEWGERSVTDIDVEAGGCWIDETFAAMTVRECSNGRRLWWNDWGWGHVGWEGTEHLPGVEKVPPPSVQDSCGI